MQVFAIAVVAVTLASDSVMLDDSTELLQESVSVDLHAGAKVGAKISNKAKVANQVKARATVMIGTHELDAEEVEMAKSSLSKITRKLGARHPIFLGETAK